MIAQRLPDIRHRPFVLERVQRIHDGGLAAAVWSMSKMLSRLDIRNFRSLEDFHVPKLGQVNLIVGRNNSGKSTVLEALRIYAGGAARPLLEEIATDHDEKAFYFGEGLQSPDETPFANFFTRNGARLETGRITIGDISTDGQSLIIERAQFKEIEEPYVSQVTKREITRTRHVRVDPDNSDEDAGLLRWGLEIRRGEGRRRLFLDSSPRIARSLGVIKTENCSFIPARKVFSDELAREWDKILFTDNEETVTSAVRYVAPELEAIAFVEAESVPARIEGRLDLTLREKRRIPVVKLRGISGTMPLNSLGDGAYRVFNLSLKTISAQGGFLLIDEFENGIHYSAQKNLWKFVCAMSKRFNFQVFATTHSWDCISAFAEVASQDDAIDGMLFRVGRSARTSNKNKTIATTFDEGQLLGLQQADLEVR